MWIPAPIYERLPQFWLLLGLLFMASGVFLGFEYWLSFVYLGVGGCCCGWSVWTLTTRLAHRRPANDAAAEKAADSSRPAKAGREEPLPHA